MTKKKVVSKMYKVLGANSGTGTAKQISWHRTLKAAEKAFKSAKSTDVRYPYQKPGEDIVQILLVEMPYDVGLRYEFHSLEDFKKAAYKTLKTKST